MQPKQSSITMPGAVIIAGAIIALAIIWVKQPARLPANSNNQANQALQNAQSGQINMRDVSSKDHIYGNPNAPVIIVEYSDPSCPFCKTFNPIMEQIIAEYGPSGKVAWVYRHFPLDKADENGYVLHKNAGLESQAMECAAALGGNDKFWAYEKRLYEITPSVTQKTPDGLDPKKLPEIAKYIGLDVTSFNECLSNNQFRSKVDADFTDGINAGVTGTPYSIIITPKGSKIPLVGAQSYNNIKTAIDALLSESPKQ